MTRTITALPLLIERSREARDLLANAARQAGLALQQAEATLAQLAGFRQDYLRRAPTTGTAGFTIDQLQDWQRFVTRLDQALATQREECERRRQLEAMRQRQLAEGQRRLLAYEALAARQDAARDLRLTRQAQRESDEFAARATRIHMQTELR